MVRADLVTIGEAFEDLVFFELTRLPRSGEEVKTSRFLRTQGGGALITAVAAARLGASCAIISGLSTNAEDLLGSEGIQVHNVKRPSEPHAVTACLSTRADRSFVTFNGINDELEERLLPLASSIDARHAHFAFPPRASSAWSGILEGLRRQGTTTSWDFGWNEWLARDPELPRLFSHLDYLFINEDEALLYGDRRTFEGALERFRTESQTTVIKRGARGAMAVGPQGEFSVPAHRVRVLDTTGAGDAFNGGFLYALLRGLNLKSCLDLGNAVGSFCAKRAGGIEGLPRREELV